MTPSQRLEAAGRMARRCRCTRISWKRSVAKKKTELRGGGRRLDKRSLLLLRCPSQVGSGCHTERGKMRWCDQERAMKSGSCMSIVEEVVCQCSFQVTAGD